MQGTIRWIVDEIPPSTPDDDVESQFRARCEDARARGHDVSEEKEQEIVESALRYHQENRRIHDFTVWALTE